MSKVLVDRELLNSALKTIHGLAPGRFAVEQELRAAVTAQPAEAEWVVFGFDDRSVKVSQEAYSIFLARERHHLAALSAVTAERDRLRDQVKALQSDANSWQSGYDKGRCDGTKHRQSEVDQLRAEVEALRKAAEPLEPVHDDQLPPIGSKVLIHLASCDDWIEHTVAGYYAWGDLEGEEHLHRVFVRVRDSDGYLNARLLKDVRPVGAAMAAKEA